MPKVILINLPPGLDYDYINIGEVYPATGILLIGTIFKSKGVTVQVIDGAVRKDYQKIVLESIDKDTVMIGFSVMTSQVTMALDLSELIKSAYSNTPIAWGGIHPALFPKETVSNQNIDIVVTGEGLETTLNLISYINGAISLGEVKGIGFKNSSGDVVLTGSSEPDDINKIPHIDFSILDNVDTYLNARSYFLREINTDNNEKLILMPVFTGHGCSYKCQFCINSFLKRKYRFRSSESIIHEIKKLQNDYGANAFVFLDENFLTIEERLVGFLNLIEKENLKFYWRIWGRVNYFNENYLNRDMVLRLEKDGLRSIVMGGESGSQKVLSLIDKGIKVENIIHSIRLLKETKITPRCSFIVGLEGENKEDSKATYKLCADLIDLNPKVDIAGPVIFRYYPGSPIFDRIIKKYSIALPQRIEDWRNCLSKEGYLEIDEMPWLWPGFTKTIRTLNGYMNILMAKRHNSNFGYKLIKKIIKWRVRKFDMVWPLEPLSLYKLFVKLRNIFYQTKKID